jgi:multidrug efflux pump subunit AcrA (membrane-fusion protein)
MGMFVKGEFDLGQKTAITIPQTALLLRDGFAYVFIAGNDNRVSQQKVEVGPRLGNRVELLNFAPNVKVVSSGTGFLTDGDFVNIVKEIPDTPLSKQLVTTQE